MYELICLLLQYLCRHLCCVRAIRRFTLFLLIFNNPAGKQIPDEFAVIESRKRPSSRMDPTMCNNITEDDYTNVKLSALRLPTRERLSCMLNTRKVLCSSEKLPRYMIFFNFLNMIHNL